MANPGQKNDLYIPEVHQERNLLGKWAAFFIKRYRITCLIIIILFVWGSFSYTKLPREVLPKVIIPSGMVITTYLGASPEEVESLITDKLEKRFRGLDNVKRIMSTSGFGYSSIYVEFETDVDHNDMMQKLREKVSAAQPDLPDGAGLPEVLDFDTGKTPIMIINVAGDYNDVQLKQYAERITDELEKARDVSEVSIVGGVDREIRIMVDPQKLAAYNLSLNQISNAIKLSNVNFPGGNAVLDEKDYNIRTVGRFAKVQELENVVVSFIGGRPLLLRDIAEIEDGYSDPRSYSRITMGVGTAGQTVKKSIALSVVKKDKGDIITVSKLIKDMLAEKKGELYPENLQIYISGDMSLTVEEELGAVLNSALSGLILVLIVLFFFIGLKESFIVATVIPLSILSAFGILESYGMTLNTISLFAMILAVGLLVDNGIVIMENINRLRGLGIAADIAAESGTNQIAPAVASSTLTTLAAFFPLMLTSGVVGDFVKSIPITVIVALAASFFVAVTVTPVMSAVVLRGGQLKNRLYEHPVRNMSLKIISVAVVFILAMYVFRDTESQEMGFGLLSWIFGAGFAVAVAIKQFCGGKGDKRSFIKWYGDKIYWLIAGRWRKLAVIGIALAAFALSISLIPAGILKVDMFPLTDNPKLYVDIRAPKGTQLDETNRIVSEVERRLYEFPEIKSFVTNVGMTGADNADYFVMGSGGTPNIGRIIIDLYERKNRQRTSMQVAEEIRESLRNIPGAGLEVLELKSGPPSGRPVNIQLLGEDLEELKIVARDFAQELESVAGVRDVSDGIEKGYPELQVKVDKEKAAAFGLDNMTVALGIRNAVHGLTTTTFRDNQDEIDVVIRTSKTRIQTVTDLENLYFNTQSGQQVPFSQVAGIEETKSLNVISHDDGKRYVSITSDVETGLVTSDIVNKFRQAIAGYPLPEGITIIYGGEMEDMEVSFGDMFRNMIIALLLVFLILAVQFNSLSQPFIILLTLPLALIGVMPGLVITGNNFDFVAFIGVVALVGIAVNNAIILVDYINYLRKNGYSLEEAIKRTGMTRFIPVLATTVTTVGGILPITIRQPFMAPMGYALIFGLLTSTILTLVIVPVVYSLFERTKQLGSGLLATNMAKNRAENEVKI